jgi:hypothetical protein
MTSKLEMVFGKKVSACRVEVRRGGELVGFGIGFFGFIG